MKNARKKQSRRDFLKAMGAYSTGSALLYSPLQLFMGSIVGSLFTRSVAHALGENPRRYVSIQTPQAPPRWMYDLLLNPYSNAVGESTLNLGNAMLGTRYTEQSGRYTGVEYRTVKRRGLNLPWMWQFNLPAPNNLSRPMTQLLDHAMVIQGMTTTNPGHPGSLTLHFQPAGSAISTTALSADNTNDVLSAVNMSASQFVFSSLAGKSAVTVGSNSNMLTELFRPFISNANANFKNRKRDVASQLNGVANAMNAAAQSDDLIATSLINTQKNAEQMILDGIQDYQQDWQELVAKYNDLITRSLTTTLTGINDKPIGVAQINSRNSKYFIENELVGFADLRQLFNSTTLKIDNLAEHFAVTEYLLKNNLSHSITFPILRMTGLKTQAGFNKAGSHNSDEHQTGQMVSLYLNTMKHFAFSSCLLELIQSLKNAPNQPNLWRDTLIEVSGEFNRSARIDGSGSDHGYLGKSVAIYSGGFNNSSTAPIVIGNIEGTAGAEAWGMGRDVRGIGRQLDLRDMMVTFAHLLRVPAPLTTGYRLVTLNENNRTLTANYDLTKRV